MKKTPALGTRSARRKPFHGAGRIAAILALAAVLAGCSHPKVTFYKPNADQEAFDRDSSVCMENAKKAARAQLVTPNREPDERVVMQLYADCITASGWSQIPLDKRELSLWKAAGSQLSFGSLALTLPPGFSVKDRSSFIIGPAWCDQVQATNEDATVFMTLVAQESFGETFAVVEYPVPAGFSLYAKGSLNKYNTKWAIFTGYSMQKPVAFLAMYINLSKRQRISLVFNKSLPVEGAPQPGYPLSVEEKNALEALYPGWLSWVKTQTGAAEGEKIPLRKRIRIFPIVLP
jgi:hypothetical protein